MRTLLAYILAPIISSLIIVAFRYDYGIEGMLVMFFTVSILTFPVSAIVAVISHFALSKLKKANIFHYFLAGALAASPISILWSIGERIDYLSLLLFTLIGGLVGVFVKVIQGPRNPSRRSDQLRYGSASTT